MKSLISLMFLLAASGGFAQDTVSSKDIMPIIQTKCNSCHISRNPRRVFTESNIERYAREIHVQVFKKRRMPKSDGVKLTVEEESLLLRWLNSLSVSSKAAVKDVE